MNLHEYQAKEVLSAYGVAIPPYGVATSIRDVEHLFEKLKLTEAVLKIQVHAGGRGKAGGVKQVKNLEEAKKAAASLIGMKMVNNQTGPQGVVANQILVTSPIAIQKEYYLGAIIDRAQAKAILIASAEGGMEIEEIAHKSPEKILKIPIELNGKVRSYHLWRLCHFMDWKGSLIEMGMRMAKAVAKAFMESDASLLEINPLVLDTSGKLWALDAKLSIDDNALFRHEKLSSYYDPTQGLESEAKAREYDLAYIALDGNIGCMVNGAGLAMATMDIIQHYGGKPANFLDVGGGASQDKVAEGFKIILSDPGVKVILVNIFGGIMNCATIAQGIIQAIKGSSIEAALVVRLEGTNVEEGKRLLKESGLAIITAEGLSDAAEKVVAISKTSR